MSAPRNVCAVLSGATRQSGGIWQDHLVPIACVPTVLAHSHRGLMARLQLREKPPPDLSPISRGTSSCPAPWGN